LTALDTTQFNFTLTDFVISDATGRIVLKGNIPAYQLYTLDVPEGGQILDVKGDIDLDYVTNKTLTKRPVNPTTLSGMKLMNVPNPSSVTIAGVNPQTVTDGEVDLEFTQPGTYTIVVSSWPALDANFTVTQP
jgi:hypothetical protein